MRDRAGLDRDAWRALLGLGQYAVPLAGYFIVGLAVGIALVHAPSGWFVVGLGRNGMEYSVLLIVCLVAVRASH